MHHKIAAACLLALSCDVCGDAAARQPASDHGRHADEPRLPRLRLADMDHTAGKQPGDTPRTGRERQNACAAQWRVFSAAERTAQGPKWPQFYNRCIKRLKALKN